MQHLCLLNVHANWRPSKITASPGVRFCKVKNVLLVLVERLCQLEAKQTNGVCVCEWVGFCKVKNLSLVLVERSSQLEAKQTNCCKVQHVSLMLVQRSCQMGTKQTNCISGSQILLSWKCDIGGCRTLMPIWGCISGRKISQGQKGVTRACRILFSATFKKESSNCTFQRDCFSSCHCTFGTASGLACRLHECENKSVPAYYLRWGTTFAYMCLLKSKRSRHSTQSNRDCRRIDFSLQDGASGNE